MNLAGAAERSPYWDKEASAKADFRPITGLSIACRARVYFWHGMGFTQADAITADLLAFLER
jgi:hypothetical protein